jgi:hypothetical protein
MSLERGVEVAGLVSLLPEAGASDLPALNNISVALVPHDQARPTLAEDLSRRLGGARVSSDGKFVVRGLQPGGVAAVAVAGLPRGWWVESAMLNGVDFMESPRAVHSVPAASGLQITLTNETTEVTGVVEGSDTVPISSLAIVLVPADWRDRPVDSQRIRMVTVAEDGTFAVRQVVPGRYILSAVVGMELSDVRHPDTLSQLDNASIQLNIRRGERIFKAVRVPKNEVP